MKIQQFIHYFDFKNLNYRNSVNYLSLLNVLVKGIFCAFLLIAMSGFFYTTRGQSFTVSGKVTTAKNDQPLPGVSVKEKGANNGTTTDAEGAYRLQLQNGEAKLVFKHIGYVAETIAVNDRHTINLAMEESVKELNQVVITGTRSATEVESLPQKIQVVDRQTLQNTIGEDIADIMKKNTGVDVIQYPGLLSGIGIRGFRPDPFGGVNQRSLTLIDGRPAGATNMALIGLQNIDRIEVQKGPASALYGSQAMGGVINIITKESQGPVKGQANIGYGSFNTVQAGISTGGNITQRLDYDLGFSYFERGDDYRIGKDNIFRNLMNADQAQNIYHAGDSTGMIDDTVGDGQVRPNTTYSRYAGSLRLGYQLSDNWRLNIKGDRFFAQDVNSPGNIFDGVSGRSLKDVKRNSGDISLEGTIGGNHDLLIRGYAANEFDNQYSVNATDTTNVVEYYPSNQNDWQWKGIQVKDVVTFGDHTIIGGLDYNDVFLKNQRFNPDGTNAVPYNPNYGLNTTGVYLQGHLQFLDEKLNVTLGGRYENIKYEVLATDLLGNEANSESNNTFNPSFGVKYHLLPSLSVRGTYGTGFTTQNPFNIAGYAQQDVWGKPGYVTITEGNPDLENVQSSTWEAGLSFHPENSGFKAEGTWFRTKLRNNPIQQVTTLNEVRTTPAGDTIQSINTYVNADASYLNGLEFNAEYDFGALQGYRYSLKLFANSVIINKAREVRDVYAVGERESRIHNVADATVNYGISYDNFSWLNLRLTGRYVGTRYDRNWDYFASLVEIEYPPFMVMDFVGTLRFNQQKHELKLKVGNLTDENYYEKRGFNLPGRNFHVGYVYNF